MTFFTFLRFLLETLKLSSACLVSKQFQNNSYLGQASSELTVCCLPTSSVFSQWHVLVFFYRSGSPMFSHISVFSVVQVEKILLTFVQVNFLNSLRFAVCFLQDCPVFSPINIFSGEIFQTFQCLSCVFQYRLAKFPQRAKLASSLVGRLLPAKRSPNTNQCVLQWK